MVWHPSQNKLKYLMDRNMLEFVLQENQSTKIFDKKWVHKYIYTKFYEILFFSFTSKLWECLSQLSKFNTYVKEDAVTEWTLKLIQQS